MGKFSMGKFFRLIETVDLYKRHDLSFARQQKCVKNLNSKRTKCGMSSEHPYFGPGERGELPVARITDLPFVIDRSSVIAG